MPYTVGNFGLRTLVPLGKLMLSVYTTMFLFVFVALGLIARLYGFNLWKSLEYIKVEILLVLGTSSSEAALPRMMDKLEKFGCAKPIVGLVIPTGYSFNLDGTSIYLSMATVFLAQVSGVDLTLGRELTVLGVLMLTSRGAAGVTGSGFIVLASSLSAMKIIPVTSIALLLGVDRFMSEALAGHVRLEEDAPLEPARAPGEPLTAISQVSGFRAQVQGSGPGISDPETCT